MARLWAATVRLVRVWAATIDSFAPYEPSAAPRLDFSDANNSMYIALF